MRPAMFFATLGAVFVGIILAVVVLAVVSTQPGHPDLFDHQNQIIDNQESIMCLILIDPTLRVEQAAALCQVNPETLFEE